MNIKPIKLFSFLLATLLISGCSLLPTLPSHRNSVSDYSSINNSSINSNSKNSNSKSSVQSSNNPSSTQDDENFDYEYIGDNQYGIRAGINRGLDEIYIPSTYNGIPVTEILDNGFENCNARKIIIPDSITRIGQYAFYFCSNLENIIIPNSVKSIGGVAFGECNNMIFAQFLAPVPPTIGKDLFCITWNREDFSIIVPNGSLNAYLNVTAEFWENAVPRIIEENNKPLIDENGFRYTAYNNGYAVSAGANRYKSGEIIIPSTFNGKPVLSIAERGFSEAQASSIILPSSLLNIQSSAFENCYYLFSITIPMSVETIGPYAFAYSQRLRTIFMESNNSPIVDQLTFVGLESNRLVSIVVPDGRVNAYKANLGIQTNNIQIISMSDYEATKEDDILYQVINGNECRVSANSDYFLNLNIPEKINGYKVTEIAQNGFDNCTIYSITFPSTLKIIGDRAFQQVVGLASVDIPSSVTSLGEQAFYCCFELKTVRFNTVTPPSIGGDLFGCTWDAEDFTILVPNAGLSAYKSITSPCWQDYAVRRIKGY